MAARTERTKTQGIFKRGSRYVFSYRVNGKQRWESFRTLDEARRAKSARITDIGRGEFVERSRVTLHAYIDDWIERYQGTGKRGFREETRSEYGALLKKYTLRYFPERTPLVQISPRDIACFIGWLVKQPNGRDGKLSDKSVRNALGPLTACLATARREGLINHNPAVGAALPHRPRLEADEDRPLPFPRIKGDDDEIIETMELVVQLVHPSHRLMFRLLAATGLRRSELLALEGCHLALDGEQPHVKVRQRVRRRRSADPNAFGRPSARPGHAAGPARVPLGDRHRDRPGQPRRARARARVRGGRGRVGGLPHLPPHGRVAAVRGGSERRTGPALAWPPRGELHAGHVRPPAR